MISADLVPKDSPFSSPRRWGTKKPEEHGDLTNHIQVLVGDFKVIDDS